MSDTVTGSNTRLPVSSEDQLHERSTQGTFAIAECGMCHDGSLDTAYALVDVAAQAGADAAKFQWWSSSERLAHRRHRLDRQPLYERYRVPAEWLQRLHKYCGHVGIEFMCSSYLPEDVWRVAEYVQTLKIASPEANDREHLVAHIGPVNAGRRVLISMGLGAKHDVIDQWLLRGLDSHHARWSGHPRVQLLHCVSAYPTPVDQLGLYRLRGGWATGEVYHGFSDHAPPDVTLTGAVAVAAGATVVERHLRLDDTAPENPDYAVAMTPGDFKNYVSLIRFADTAVGTPTHRPERHAPCEEARLDVRVWA